MTVTQADAGTLWEELAARVAAGDRFAGLFATGAGSALVLSAHVATDIPQWDPDAGGPAYVYMRVADHIAARIAAGDLPAEARLPAERDLAAEYAVAIGTARRAVLELRDRGLVVTLPGKGTYVVSPPQDMSEARSLRPTAG